MSILWDRVPGADPIKSINADIADILADRVATSLPAEAQSAISRLQVAKGVGEALASARNLAAGASLGSVAAFAYAGLQTINGALNKIAALLREDMGSDWSDAIDKLSEGLINEADGRILATYQPADELTLKRAQSFTSKWKKDGKTELSELVAQFRPGYVVGINRLTRSDYIAATVPILVFTGHPMGSSWRGSIYGNGKAIGPVGDDWGPDNRWQPMGLTDYFEGMPFPEWILLARELKFAKGCPPVRQRITVAPGLAPFWGPYGKQQPMGPRLIAYAASLHAHPPPDLDFVAEKIAAERDWNKTINVDATGILELLWSREDQARRGNPAAGEPRGDEWPGPFMEEVYGKDWSQQGGGGIPDSPGGEVGQKIPGGMGGKGPGGLKGEAPKTGGGGGALVGLGLGALALGGGAMVARQVFAGKKGRKRPAKRSPKRSIWTRRRRR